MPKSTPYTLAWSNSHQAYELYEGQGDDDTLDLDTQCHTPLVWVGQVSSFAFHGQHGSYTARKERKQRGDEYWYAYVRIVGKLTKKYLGRSSDLTFARLEQAAQELWLAPQTSLPQSRYNRVAARKIEKSSATSGIVAEPLLTTKLHVPRPRPHQVQRTRLIQRLQQGMERKLTLISAPAGFGKTTLLANWLASCAIPAAWFSLEPQDNEPTRFLSYLIAALQTLNPRLGTTAQALLYPLQPPPMETVLTLLINDLLTAGTVNQEHFVLVLDNYQVITVEAIHHALSFLLSHLPPQLHLILSTREDPPLPLAHLRGRDDLLEARAADLRFTQEETNTYLVDMMGLSLSTQEIALLEERTEGWITGLHLVALSLQGRDDQADFIIAFTGSHHYVADYLLGEVLNRQSKDIQGFLLQTCILERLNPLLCDAVRVQEGSGILLDFLERANLFLVPLDDERQWYRYHHLFAAVLRQRLLQTAPALATDLHHRASGWYEQHGFFAEAVLHALAAPAFTEAARLIEQYAWVFIAENQMQTLCEWLQALPESLFTAHSSLFIIHAITLLYTNRPQAAWARLRTAQQTPDLDVGQLMITLLQEAQQHGLAPEYIATLLAAKNERSLADAHLSVFHSNSFMEPLTTREREVLLLLLDGCSNREISSKLIVSVNTAKKHVLNICSKLNVRSRTHAIAKARMLHLLDATSSPERFS